MEPVRKVTLLDLRLGLVEFTDEQMAIVREKTVPILARITRRILNEQRTAREAQAREATGTQDS